MYSASFITKLVECNSTHLTVINRNNLSQYPAMVFHPMLEEELGTGWHLELIGLSEYWLVVVGGGVGCYIV